jgi:hypothetical protein
MNPWCVLHPFVQIVEGHCPACAHDATMAGRPPPPPLRDDPPSLEWLVEQVARTAADYRAASAELEQAEEEWQRAQARLHDQRNRAGQAYQAAEAALVRRAGGVE